MSGFMNMQETASHSTCPEHIFAGYDMENLLSHIPAGSTGETPGSSESRDRDDTAAALRLAMIAMKEAEQRIARQEKRIAFLESLSMTDELTGLLNRRGFDERLRSALAVARRQGIRGTLLIIDLDRFKTVNDTWGHAAGDALLVAAAGILRARIRETDSVARIGGDEFAVILSGASDREVRSRIRELDRELNTRTVQWHGSILHLHASVGHGVYGPDDTGTGLFDRVDRAMYARKRSGASVAPGRP